MNQLIYIMSSTAIVAIIAVLGIIRIRQYFKEKNTDLIKKDANSNGPIRAIALSLVIGGIVLGTDRLISYSFFGASILISIIDIIKNRRAI